MQKPSSREGDAYDRIGVDEITLVLQASDDNRMSLLDNDWHDVAEYIILQFERNADLRNIMGKRCTEEKKPAGYTVAYKYGDHNFYFAIAYHDYHISMGVCIKFSAQALDFYLESTNEKVYQFLQKVSSEDYNRRLSRIDLTADFINEDVDISNIYQGLMDSKVAVFREQFNAKLDKMEYRKVPMKYKGIIVKDEVETIYVGSEKSKSRLRIYDKRIEQIQRKGNKLEKALNCNSWVRFEGVFRDEYAHQLSSALMSITSDDEYANLIALTLYQKYFFMEVENGVANVPTEYTQMLIDCVSNHNFKLRTQLARNYDLARNITYMFDGSGVMSTFFKLKEIWGMDAVMWLMELIAKKIQGGYVPSDDCRYWLNHNMLDYQRNYPDFEEYVRKNLSVLLKD